VDGLEPEVNGRASVVRVQIQTDAGREAAARYGAVFTPTFVVFDRAGTLVDRGSNAEGAASRLRSLLASP
jgi:hypothetical protein